jgi:hypothetical protein
MYRVVVVNAYVRRAKQCHASSRWYCKFYKSAMTNTKEHVVPSGDKTLACMYNGKSGDKLDALMYRLINQKVATRTK